MATLKQNTNTLCDLLPAAGPAGACPGSSNSVFIAYQVEKVGKALMKVGETPKLNSTANVSNTEDMPWSTCHMQSGYRRTTVY